MNDTLLWTINETAHQLGISPRTMRRMVDRGELPAVKIGRAARIPAQAARNWVADHTQAADNGRRVGSGVRQQEVNVCRINAKIAASGGLISQTQAAKELENLLERRNVGKQKP